MLFEVGAGADPVHNREKSWCMERSEDPVPCVSVKVDGLRTISDESADVGGCAAHVVGNDNQERVFGHRNEGLSAVRVAFHHIERVGQCARFGLKDRHACAAFCEVEFCEVVVPLAFALIDRFWLCRIRCQHIAVKGESVTGQGFGGDGHRNLGWRLTSL